MFSLQWFKTKPVKKSVTKLIHSVSARNVEEMFATKSFTVAHEVEALVIVSQPDENHSNADGIELEHARNGKD